MHNVSFDPIAGPEISPSPDHLLFPLLDLLGNESSVEETSQTQSGRVFGDHHQVHGGVLGHGQGLTRRERQEDQGERVHPVVMVNDRYGSRTKEARISWTAEMNRMFNNTKYRENEFASPTSFRVSIVSCCSI